MVYPAGGPRRRRLGGGGDSFFLTFSFSPTLASAEVDESGAFRLDEGSDLLLGLVSSLSTLLLSASLLSLAALSSSFAAVVASASFISSFFSSVSSSIGLSTSTAKTSPPKSSSSANGSSSSNFFRTMEDFLETITPFSIPSPSRISPFKPEPVVVSAPTFSSSSTRICSTSSTLSMTPLINMSTALRKPILGNKSSGLTPSIPVNGQRKPLWVRASRMQDSQVERPSGSQGKRVAFLKALLQMGQSK
mmetsp:Transcript_18113/g.44757  ORF Transcript_18113/g.44757 Transcript_18113/m.44757 type:complete len:248 (-) Transcript_18113:5067-5810(-)